MLLAVLARHAGLRLGEQEVYAATVGGLAAHEPAADLAIGLALASAAQDLPLPPTACAVGEVSLSGDIRRVSGLGRRLAEAARLGFTVALVPAAHRGEHLDPGSTGIRTVEVATISEALRAAAHLATHPAGAPAARRRPTLHAVATGDTGRGG
jgi:DNA repair protein RadA/Sms